jgi:FHS family L-fucose permease-like MFS transporter
MLLGLLISALGCFLFYPAAVYSVYGLFLGALFVLGLGFTLLQITANPYVSLLGSPAGASSRLNLSQAFNALGTTIAPIGGGFLIFEFFTDNGVLSAEATKVPYIVFAFVFLLVGLIVYKIKLPSFRSDETEHHGLGALKFPQLKLGIFAIFVYVGAEVTIGSFFINFLEQENIMNMSEIVSKNYLALYWGGAMIGRFLGSISLHPEMHQSRKVVYMTGIAVAVFLLIFSIVDLSFAQMSTFIAFILLNLLAFFIGKAAAARTLSIFAFLNLILLLFVIFGDGSIAMWAIISIGLFNSIMWSNIFTLSINGLGRYTSQGSSLLVMAILGGALIPLLQGAIADNIGIQLSFFVPFVCYVYLVYFGVFFIKSKIIL